MVSLNDSGPGTLRQAILDANATPGADTITFTLLSSKGYSASTISLVTPLPVISQPLSIIGPGPVLLTINANGTGRTMEVGIGVSATVSGLTLSGGASDFGAGFYINPGANVTLTNMIFQNNDASGSDGGGISNDGSLILKSSIIRNNKAAAGGGVSNFEGTMDVSGTQITNNTALEIGGGVFNMQNANIHNSTISNNTVLNSSGCCGGGIGNFSSSSSADTMLFIESTHIDNNTGPDGGGISNTGTLQLLGGTEQQRQHARRRWRHLQCNPSRLLANGRCPDPEHDNLRQ